MFWAYEAEGEFVYTSGGQDHSIPAAALVHHELLVEILADDITFASWAGLPPCSIAVVAEVRRLYCLHQGLPKDGRDAEHLVALLTRFGDELEVDLRERGLDLRADFQARRWRRLLNAIDHLPYATHYRQTMLNDPEMARAIMEREAKREDGATRRGIPVSEYTQTVSMLRDVITTLRGVQASVIASAGGKPGATEPYPGPLTMLKQAEFDMRQAQHEALVDRVLPGKRTALAR